MDNRKKLALEITHGGCHVDYLTENQILKLNHLLKFGGKRRINNNWYEVSNSSFILYKSKKFSGSNYSFDLSKSQKIVGSLI